MIGSLRNASSGRALMFRWLAASFLLASTAIDEAASSPLVWHWSNPFPHGNNIADVCFANGIWVEVCDAGQLYSSIDSLTWFPLNSQTNKALRALTFYAGRWVITGEEGTVLYADSLDSVQSGQLLDGSTSDWLEAVTCSSNVVVAVGDNGAIYTSGDGAVWKRHSVGFNTWLEGVAYGAGTFVAVGGGGLVATSADGTNWQTRVSGTTADLNRVAWLSNTFLAVGSGGAALQSANGIHWVSAATGATNDLYALAGYNRSQLVTGDKAMLLQENQGPWINELASGQPAPPPTWTYLSALWATNAAGGGAYFLGGLTGVGVQGARTNAASPVLWATVDQSLRNWLWEVVHIPTFAYARGPCENLDTSLYVTAGDRATVMTSTEGAIWQLQAVPSSVTNAVFLGVGGSTNGLVVVGNQGSLIFSPSQMVTAVYTNAQVVNGITNQIVCTNQINTMGDVWLSVAPPTPNDLQGVCTFANTYVVTGGGGTILTSANGTNWNVQPSPVTTFLSSVAAFPGGLVAVGDMGTILTSSNGTNWTQHPPSTTNWIYRVRFVNGNLVAVGQNGLLMTSADGSTWAKQSTGTTAWLNDVAFVGDTYFVVGTQGTVLSSTNGTTWTEVGTITSKSLYGAATADGKLVTVGIEGVILRSQVLPITDPIGIALDHTVSSDNVATNQFAFFGTLDQQFTLDRSTNLVDWTTGPLLEFDTLGGGLFYQEEVTSPPNAEFYRAAPLK